MEVGIGSCVGKNLLLQESFFVSPKGEKKAMYLNFTFKGHIKFAM